MLIIFIYAAQDIADLFRVKSDSDTGVTQPKLGNTSGDLRYILERNAREFKLDYSDMEKAREVIQFFFQPWAAYQVFIPQNSFFLERILSGKVPQKVYIGLGYNDTLAENGERVDILDFFSWAKGVQDKIPELELVIWDASSYWLFNEMDPRTMPRELRQDSASEILRILSAELENNPKVRRNCALWGKYLQAISKATGVKSKILV
ncbi:MAG: hypothetical protein V2A62_04205, partial [Candidatus Woesearchaeota archaeon]